MSVKTEDLELYLREGADLIPLNIWNKKRRWKNGRVIDAGKSPLHDNWPTRTYSAAFVKTQIEQGYNAGYRIGSSEAILDLDPRNMDLDEDNVLESIAELLGHFDWSEVEENERVVRTGSGGYHVYLQLPDEEDPADFREVVEELPGVELKKVGRQVVCAGSRHPNGEYYTWINRRPPNTAPAELLETFRRGKRARQEYSSGYGALTGQQLQDLILSQLDPNEYSSNDKWFPLLCGSHHATGGEGVDEFVEWSTGDPDYAEDEGLIRYRWDSLSEKENEITIGTLIHEVEKRGGDTNSIRAVLDFGSVLDDDEDLSEYDISDIDEILVSSREAADDIDVEDLYHEQAGSHIGEEGAALEFANTLRAESANEEVAKALRLVKAADPIEAERALEMIQAQTGLKRSALNKILSSITEKLSEDLARILSEKTLENVFNKGKHLTLPPNGQLWVYHKTHWRPMSDEYLGKILINVMDKLKKKMDLDVNENALITSALTTCRRLVASPVDKIHRTSEPHPVINCRNGELWIDKDGQHSLKRHSYRSYLLQCLDVDYDPSAECPLFMETIHDIFSNFPDGEDMVRHLAEVFGYISQPYKNIASWWLFRGPGGDGKSTLLKILGGILQDAQVPASVKLLASGSSDGNAHAFASLVGKLNVVIEEMPANYLLNDSGVKMLSENTTMEANPKHKAQFKFMYCGSLVMCSNGYPAIRDLSHGMYRRANVVPFNRQFTVSNEADVDRAQKILRDPKEMSGVLNWMLEGLQRMRKRGGFLIPESCQEAKDEWIMNANNVVRFVRETLTRDPDGMILAKDLYSLHYENWCIENDVKKKGRNHFFQDLRNLGFIVKNGHSNRVYIYGCTMAENLGGDEGEDWDDDL